VSKYVDGNYLVSDAEAVHIAAIKVSAITRQAAEAVATTQKSFDAAAAAHYRAVIASARLNNVNWGYEPAWNALRSLTGGA
jgi:hypothetical protein